VTRAWWQHVQHDRRGDYGRHVRCRVAFGIALDRRVLHRRPSRDAFARELDLTPEQLVVADSILRHEFEAVNAIREDTWPKMQAIMDNTRRKLDSVLSPGQRERYHERLAEQDQRFRPRDAGRPSFPFHRR